MTSTVEIRAAEGLKPTIPVGALMRMARRSLRGGLAGFGIFLACIAIGVAAITGVGSTSRGFSDGLARQSQVILGGDAAFSTTNTELPRPERTWLAQHGAVSVVATLRAMARTASGSAALIDLKAVGPDWPSHGRAVVNPARALSQLLDPKSGAYGLIADPSLAARLNLAIGDRVTIGDQTFELRGTLISEPDALAGGLALGPRVIITRRALHRTGLLQPGALMQWTYRVTLRGTDGHPSTEAQAEALVKTADAAFPSAGWIARTRANVSPQFAESLQQLTQFLTLVGLTALIIGGLGVAAAARAFVDRKRGEFATLKSLGASGSSVFVFSLLQVMAIAALGVACGLAIGAAIPFVIAWGFGRIIPIPFAPAVYPDQLALGAFYGLLAAFTFSVGPLGRAHEAPVAALFRDHVEPERRWPQTRYLVMIAAALAVLAGSMVLLASDRLLALIYIGAVAAGYALLQIVAWALMGVARRAPHLPLLELRLAVGNLHRPGALTPSVILSLGLGLALVVALTFINGNLRQEIGHATPGRTPSLFFLDVPQGQDAAFQTFVHEHAPSAKLEEVPMLRGRVTRLNAIPVDRIKPEPRLLEGDRGITYAAAPPIGSQVIAGTWWPAGYAGPPLVSLDAEIANDLGLKLGDTITVNVLGRDVTARIKSLRRVDWRTMGINFIFVFSPDAFAGAPHTTLASAAFPETDATQASLALLRDVANAYPTTTVVSVRDALSALNQLLDKVGLAVSSASSVAILSSVLVLAGALASGQRNRVYDAVVLKTLGATRPRLVLALTLEYTLLGLSGALFGVLTGGVAGYVILTHLMHVEPVSWLWSSAALAAIGSLIVAVVLGLLGTWRALGQKPGPYLRAL